MNDRDLIDILQAIHLLSEGVRELSKDLPLETVQRLSKHQQGVQAAITNVIGRRDPHSPEFTETDEGLTFTREFPFMLDDSVNF
jgi:hypothetical protein